MSKRLKIGLQIGSIESGLKLEIFNRVSRICRERNHDFYLIPSDSDSSGTYTYQQESVFRHITKKNLDAVIVESSQFEDIKKNLLKDYPISRDQEVPMVSILERSDEIPSIYADLDDYDRLINHMIYCHDCKKFNIIAGPKTSQTSMDRLNYCLNVLSAKGLDVDDNRIFYGNFDNNTGYGAMVYFQSEHILDCDCVIALNDDMALGALRFCNKRNISVPEDIKIIGFDNINQSRYEDISITTIGPSMEDLCAKAVDFAEGAAEGEELPLNESVKCKIRFRKSCGCVSKGDYVVDYVDIEENENILTPDEMHLINQRYLSLEQDMFLMRQFFSTINEMQTITSAVLHLKSNLNILKVRSCAVVLFQKSILIPKGSRFELSDKAELVLAYEETDFKSHDLSREGYRMFNPQEGILPPDALSNRSHCLIIKALYYRESLFGYLLYEPGNLSPVLYDTAFNMVASSLNSAIVFTGKSANEKHQGELLQQLESTNSTLNKENLTDELTGLYNRRGVVTFGQETIDLAIEMDREGIVVYADMDGLKAINDTYGHDAGDLAISSMAKILKGTFRNNDIIGRMGGDEFVIIATGVNSSFLPSIRERLKAAEDKWYEETKPQFHLGISLGAIDFNSQSFNLDKLLIEADELLYKEKCQKHSRSSHKEIIRD